MTPKSYAENAMGVLAFPQKKFSGGIPKITWELLLQCVSCFLFFEQLLHDKAKHSFNICRIDDIEDNSNLRRGIPGSSKFWNYLEK